MSKILDKAIEKVKTLPRERQDQVCGWIIDFVEQDQSNVRLTPEQQEEVCQRLADPNPVVATDKEVEAFFAKFDEGKS